jgi:anti-sigma B factor antagonist
MPLVLRRGGSRQVTGMHIEKNDNWLRLQLFGEIDLVWRDAHRDDIQVAFENCPPLVIIDLENVRFMDSTGLSLVVEAYRHCMDGEVLVLNPRQLVLRTIGVAGLDKIVTIVSSCDEIRALFDRLAQLDSDQSAESSQSPATAP